MNSAYLHCLLCVLNVSNKKCPRTTSHRYLVVKQQSSHYDRVTRIPKRMFFFLFLAYHCSQFVKWGIWKKGRRENNCRRKESCKYCYWAELWPSSPSGLCCPGRNTCTRTNTHAHTDKWTRFSFCLSHNCRDSDKPRWFHSHIMYVIVMLSNSLLAPDSTFLLPTC